MSTEVPTMIDWARLRSCAGPYPPEAFVFVQEALRHTVDALRTAEPMMPEHGRHVSGRELCLGIRDYARRQFGPLALAVFAHWKIDRTEDFGRIVFALVDGGFLRKTEEDTLEDFRGIFEFDEVFEDLASSKPTAV